MVWCGAYCGGAGVAAAQGLYTVSRPAAERVYGPAAYRVVSRAAVRFGGPAATASAGRWSVDALDTQATDVAGLVRRAKAGDEDAFTQLYRLTVRKVYRYLAVRGPSEADAEELTQEVYMAAVAGLGSLRAADEAGVYAWLFQIARRKAADYLRRRYRRPVDPLADDAPLADHGSAPQELLEREAERQQVREALERLTPDQREVLLCKYVLDYTNEQTARHIGKNANAVNQLHHRALARLARLLRGDGP